MPSQLGRCVILTASLTLALAYCSLSHCQSALTKVRAANNFKLLDPETRAFQAQLDQCKGEASLEEPVSHCYRVVRLLV